jgi:hypothetical protein
LSTKAKQGLRHGVSAARGGGPEGKRGYPHSIGCGEREKDSYAGSILAQIILGNNFHTKDIKKFPKKQMPLRK